MDAQAAFKLYHSLSLVEREFMADYCQNPLSDAKKRIICILAVLTLEVFEGRLTAEQRAGYIHALDQQWGMVQ